MTNATTNVRTVKTLAEKIEAQRVVVANATAKLDELVKQEQAEQALANVAPGFVVTFNQGRAETLRTVTATVISPVYEVEGKRKIKATAGEGASFELFEVELSKLLSANAPTAEPVGEDVLAADTISLL